MGVVNVTPDSFSDGGRYWRPDDACRHARRLVDEGADVLDVGGESTRPGAEPVSAEEELRRVLPVIREAAGRGVPVSVDTVKAPVAAAALEAGAVIVNDVSALGDPEMGPLVARTGAGLVLMHMQGTPRTMQDDPQYGDVVVEVRGFLAERREAAEGCGIPRESIVLDPGIGFGKTARHNIELLASLDRLAELGSPVLVGVSRKRFIGVLTGIGEPSERGPGSLAAALAARWRGGTLFRVHDVAATRQAMTVFEAIGPPRDGRRGR
jgi:dihydropteroate synthase